MANPNQTWKYFDLESNSWKTVRKTKKKTGVATLQKKGVPIAIFWLKEGQETGSYFTVKNSENLPKGVATKFSSRVKEVA